MIEIVLQDFQHEMEESCSHHHSRSRKSKSRKRAKNTDLQVQVNQKGKNPGNLDTGATAIHQCQRTAEKSTRKRNPKRNTRKKVLL